MVYETECKFVPAKHEVKNVSIKHCVRIQEGSHRENCVMRVIYKEKLGIFGTFMHCVISDSS